LVGQEGAELESGQNGPKGMECAGGTPELEKKHSPALDREALDSRRK
jgi:hypothetical protein